MRMCPNCKIALKKKHYKGVPVDECENCGGIFFDRGELETARNNADPDTRFLDFVLFDAKDLSSSSSEQKACPKCTTLMDPLEYAGSKVIINTCSTCQGVWLDKGEFEKIIGYLNGILTKQSSSDFAEGIKTQLVEIIVGPKNEMEELKDLTAVTRLFEERWVAEHPRIQKLLEVYYDLTPFK